MQRENKKYGFVEQLVIHKDERGFLFELLRNDNVNFSKFGQVYVIGNAKQGIIRAWHRHFKMDEWFCCVRGKARFALYDLDRKKFSTHVLCAETPTLLYVPRGIFHGHKALTDDTLIIAICTEAYSKDNLDEERVPFDHFDYDWEDNDAD